MPHPKVYADFQNMGDANRLKLNCAGTREDLQRQGIELHEGCVLTLYMDDADEQGRPNELLAEGTVRYNAQPGCCVADIDWKGLRHTCEVGSR
jgi:hypothetical protein